MKRETWDNKKSFMESKGHLTVMRECDWKRQIKHVIKVKTLMPRILLNDSEKSLIEAICNGSVYGFVTCDVVTPIEMIKQRDSDGYLFPPIVRRMTIEDDHLSPYMKEKFLVNNRKLGKTPTVVQTYNANQIFVLTEMVRVWMKMGLKISNITEFIQYIPGKTLLPFVEKVTRMRCEATYDKDEAKATTAKLYGNSGMLNILY